MLMPYPFFHVYKIIRAIFLASGVIAASPTNFCRTAWTLASMDSVSVASGAFVTGNSWVGTVSYGTGFNPPQKTNSGSWNRCEDFPVLTGATAVNVAAGASQSLGRGGY